MFREAFEAASKALADPEMPPTTTFVLEGSDGTVDHIRLSDHPYVRVMLAAQEFFPDERQLAAASDRITALMHAISQLPNHVITLSERDVGASNAGETIRDEVFMVATEMPLSRTGKMPLGRLKRLIEEKSRELGRLRH